MLVYQRVNPHHFPTYPFGEEMDGTYGTLQQLSRSRLLCLRLLRLLFVRLFAASPLLPLVHHFDLRRKRPCFDAQNINHVFFNMIVISKYHMIGTSPKYQWELKHSHFFLAPRRRPIGPPISYDPTENGATFPMDYDQNM